ncbi:MAG: Hsp20/alpha crystallin family protein [Clostridiales bacterium]|nr:Hsp20/alpha crystallin family protein [Clostridiales bacterium]HBM80750.1 heat-shock protein [Clostridiaceae bacterium]
MFEMVPFWRGNRGVFKKGDRFNRFIDNFFNDNYMSPMDFFGNSFNVDMKETDNDYIIEADVPGVKKEDIELNYEDNYLTVSAKRNDSTESKTDNYVRQERHFGQFSRSFYVDNIDENKIDASFKDGVLKITLPKLKKGMPKRRIDIH